MRPHAVAAAVLAAVLGSTLVATANPVATPDAYTLTEDSVLAAGAEPLIDEDFNPSGGQPVPVANSWLYLDTLENQAGRGDTYPVDGAGRDWTDPDFDPASSSVAGWGTAAAPFAAGNINAFSGLDPSPLGGIDSPNTVTTYLFRSTFTLTAGQAAAPGFAARLLADDGAAIHVNGTRVAVHNLPADPFDTESFAVDSAFTEDLYVNIPLALDGVVQPGLNTIAVELHQGNPNSSDAGFDLPELVPASTGGATFTYVDDPFDTNRPNLADGSQLADGGPDGSGSLFVEVGGSNFRARSSSGGFAHNFRTDAAASLTLSFNYRLSMPDSFEDNEAGAILAVVDGVSYGSIPADIAGQQRDIVDFLSGPGETGWRTAVLDFDLPAGNHRLELGLYNNRSNTTSEIASAWFDNVSLAFAGASAAPGVLANDSGTAPLTATVVAAPSDGTLVLNPDGSFDYTPDPDFAGTDFFTYTATATDGTSEPARVDLTVTPVNDPPRATDDTYTVAEDDILQPLIFTALLANDTDVEGDPVTARLADPPFSGSVEVNPNGTFTYTPAPDYFGTDFFTYIASDADDAPPTTVLIEVEPRHDPPTARDDTYTVLENEPLTVTVPFDNGAGPQTVTLLAEQAFWRYHDRGEDLGTAWRFTAYDDSTWLRGQAELGYGDGDEVTIVSFGDDEDNKHPTTYFRTTFDVETPELATALTLSVKFDDGIAAYLNGVEVARQQLPEDAAFDTFADRAGRNENIFIDFDVDPALLVSGTNHLAVEIHQDEADSSDISLVASLVADLDTNFGLLDNDTDPDGDPLTTTVVTPPANGTIDLAADGTFTYTPGINFEGTDSFTYQADDGTEPATATVQFDVTPGSNDIPETATDTFAATEDTPLTVPAASGVLANDTDPDAAPAAMTASVASPPAHGTLDLGADGGFTYSPAGDYFGPDSFTYTATDGLAVSAPTTVTIGVAGTDDPPGGTADAYVVQPSEPLTVPSLSGVLANDSDPDGDPLTAQLAVNSTRGSVDLNPDGSFTYTPSPGFRGTDTFTYRVTDGTTPTAPLTVTLHINGRPAATADSYTTAEDTTLEVGAPGTLGNDADPEDDDLAANLASPPSHGTLALSPDGALTYTPLENFHGTDTFTYTLDDGLQSSPAATVTVTVTPVNDPPDADADDYTVEPDTTLTADAADGVLENDGDPEGDPLTVRLGRDVAHGSLSLSTDGSFTYTPDPGYQGEDSFTYIARDAELDSAETTVTIGVQVDLDALAINEIMFHPESEDDAEEFIEITNTGPFPIDLEGYTFTSGLTFTFPDVTIPPGGYLVIAADPDTFTATYGPEVTPIGPWAGSLSNRGERLRFKDPLGREADDLTYADQGEWAARVLADVGGEDGWEWSALADGGGSSLEKISNAHPGSFGQNWAPSAGAPTPGLPNSVAAPDVAPFVTGASHRPAVPSSSDPVEVKCTLTDLPDSSQQTATLHWRVSDFFFDPFQSVAMTPDGDGEFRTTLPPQPDGTIIEFYIEASDGTNARTWPAATDQGQTANALFQVDDAPHDHPGAGIYRLVMTADDADRYLADNFNRQSDALINATAILDDGSGPVVRYSAGLRNRGKSSRNHDPIPMRLNLPRDTPWDGSTRLNLNSRFSHAQVLGMLLFQAAGLPAPDARRVKVRLNGQDLSRGDRFDYGFFAHVEPLSDEFLAARFPGDDGGNLYKKEGGGGDDEWVYRDGDVGDYLGDEWTKRNNESENDWSDLDTFLNVLVNTPTDIPAVEAVADLDQWFRWFALNNLIGNGETNLSNGRADDYTQYHGENDPRMVLLPHDLDTILTMGDGFAINDPEHTLYDHTEDGDAHEQLEELFSVQEVDRRYLEAVRDLARTTLSKEVFDNLLLNLYTGWVPQDVIDNIIAFIDGRRAYALAEAENTLGPAPPLAGAANVASFESGRTSPVVLNEVLAVNDTAHDHAGAFPDVIELHNHTAAAVSVAGWGISDDPDQPGRYTLPPGTTVPAGGYLIVYAAAPAGAHGLYTGFGLSGGGESLVLTDAGGTTRDTLRFGLQAADLSLSRTGPAGTTWTLTTPTPGAANAAPLPLGDPADIRINEWLAQPEITFDDDFVELYNPSASPVAVGAMVVTDEPVAYPQRRVLPDLSFLAPGAFTVLDPVGGDADPGDATELPFRLGSAHGWLNLTAANGVEIDEIYFQHQTADVSVGRTPDGGDTLARYSVPTPGLTNAADLNDQADIIDALRVSAIMFNPPAGSDFEFLFLTNRGPRAVDLDGLRFNRGISVDLPAYTLAPGETAALAGDLAAYNATYPDLPPAIAQYSGNLSNGGERLRLEIAALGAGILDFDYKDGWQPAADGDGSYLEVVDLDAPRSAWSDRLNWRAASLTGDGGYATWARDTFGTDDPLLTAPELDPDLDGIANLLEYALGLDPVLHDGDNLPSAQTDGNGFFTFTFTRNTAATGVDLVVEISFDGLTWQSGPAFTTETVLSTSGTTQTVQARSLTPVANAPHQLLRLHATSR